MQEWEGGGVSFCDRFEFMSLDLCECLEPRSGHDLYLRDGEACRIKITLNWSVNKVNHLAGEMLTPPP